MVWWHQPLFLFIFYIFSYNTFLFPDCFPLSRGPGFELGPAVQEADALLSELFVCVLQCMSKELFMPHGVTPNMSYWLFTTITGITGVTLSLNILVNFVLGLLEDIFY
jgi:hypothetical protein